MAGIEIEVPQIMRKGNVETPKRISTVFEIFHETVPQESGYQFVSSAATVSINTGSDNQ